MSTGIIITGIIIICFIFLIIWSIYKIKSGIKTAKYHLENDLFWGRLLMSIGQAIDQKIAADKAPKPLTIADKKKNLIENIGLKTFYYLDRDQIELLYPQISGRLKLSTVTTKESLESKNSLNATIQGTVGGEIGKNKSSEVIKNFNISDNLIDKYNEIENFFMEKNSLTFGIEDFDFDEQTFNAFKRDCGIMETTYEYRISDAEQEEHWKKIKNKIAYSHLPIIKNVSGHVVIQAEFLVKQNTDTDYTLNHNHVINKFVDEKDAITIVTICNKTHLTAAATQNFKNDKSIQLTVIGKVIRWDESINTLEINPIAIY